MGAKIEAAVEFLEHGGERAVVCRPEVVVEALDGRVGTVNDLGLENPRHPDESA